jgi:hypothetical protein
MRRPAVVAGEQPPLPAEPHPDDLLNDEEAAALLGVTPSTVRAYASQSYLPRGTTVYSLRLWTRRDIETRRDTPPRQGQGGGRPVGTGSPKKGHAYEGDPRLYIAAEALTASPGTPPHTPRRRPGQAARQFHPHMGAPAHPGRPHPRPVTTVG